MFSKMIHSRLWPVGLTLFSALVSCLIGANQLSAQSKAYIGFSYPESVNSQVSMAFNTPNTLVQVQSQIPSEMIKGLKGCQILGLRFACAEFKDEVKTSLRSNKYKRISGSIAKLHTKNDWNEAFFKAPLAIDNLEEAEEGYYYMGYDFICRDPQKDIVMLDPTGSLPGSFWICLEGQWMDATQMSYNSLPIQLVVSGPDNLLGNMAILNRIALKSVMKLNSQPDIPVEIRNPGLNPIKSVTLQIRMGEETKSYKLHLATPLPAKSSKIEILHPQVDVDLKKYESLHSIEIGVKVVEVNDVHNPLAYEAVKKVTLLRSDPIVRRPLVELFSNEECTGCPRGHRVVEAALEKAAQYKPILINHHSGSSTDFLTADGEVYLNRFFLGGGFSPSLFIDRNMDNYSLTSVSQRRGITQVNSVENILAALQETMEMPAYATIDLQTGTSSDGMIELRAEGVISPDKPKDLAPYITICMIQNGIKARNQRGLSSSENESYLHNEAVRYYVTAPEGELLNVDASGKYIYQKSFRLPSDLLNGLAPVVPKNTAFVAFVHFYDPQNLNNNGILNATETPYSFFPLSMEKVSYASRLHITDGVIDPIIGAEVYVFRMDGVMLNPLHKLPKGEYIVKVVSSDGIAMHKVII